MAKQSGGGHDDGSWFLEAVGATPPSPTGSDALAELTKENEIVRPDAAFSEQETVVSDGPPKAAQGDKVAPDAKRDITRITRTTQITFSSFDGNPGTANATFAAPLPGQAFAGAPKARPATAPTMPMTVPTPRSAEPTTPITTAAAPVPQHPPTSPPTVDPQLSDKVKTNRSFRWPVLGVLVLLVIIVAIAAFWLPRATEAEALTVRQDFYDSTSAVRNHLPLSQSALDSITNPASGTDQLADAIPAIARLDTLAFAMQEAASEPLPSVFPLVPKGAIDDLVPLQERTLLLGKDGSDLAKHLGNGYIYRVSIPALMAPGNLPASAQTETISTLSITLAASLADDASVVAELPEDPTFESVRNQAIASHQLYGTWQNQYLAALTGEDPQRAQELIDEFEDMRAALNATNGEALATFRVEADQRIVSYAVDLETHMTLLTQS